MKIFKCGELVKDVLNEGSGAYGLGIVMGTEKVDPDTILQPDLEPPRYDVYFTKFEKVITFHGDYLEKV
jgi:hypothetical protein|tara:strand:+ start:88 stop:294 length:207 start_codon:yes stop_codon:yes gene_type:complete